MHIFLCMGSKFCVKFQSCLLKFHKKCWTHTPQNMYLVTFIFVCYLRYLWMVTSLPLVLNAEYSVIEVSTITDAFFPWGHAITDNLALQGYQKAEYWLRTRNCSLSSMIKLFNHLNYFNIEKWKKKICIYIRVFPELTSASKGLITPYLGICECTSASRMQQHPHNV